MNYEEFLKIPRACPFCHPSKNEIVTENEHAFITYALAPYHKDHLLVVPKRHIEKILNVTEKEEEAIYDLIRKATKILHHLGYYDLSILMRDGEADMKTVSHLHYNIIPSTHLGDIDHQGQKRKVLSEKEAQSAYERAKAAM